LVKMVILERNGVINHRQEEDITSVEDWDPIAGSIESIKRLKKAGYLVTIASNHSGVARAYYSEDDLTKMHKKMQRFPEALDVPVYDDLAHFVGDTLRCRQAGAW
jgi:D-glycero-D-manno-heptose 1,7-bisphosphate phosphatase